MYRLLVALSPFAVLLVWASIATAAVPGPTTCQNWLQGRDPYNAVDNDIRIEVNHIESYGYNVVNNYALGEYSDGIQRWWSWVFVRANGLRRQAHFACWYSFVPGYGYNGPGRDALGSRGDWYL